MVPGKLKEWQYCARFIPFPTFEADMSMPLKSDAIPENVRGDERAVRENLCEQLEAYIETNPVRAMAIALAAGIAVAKLLL